MTKKPASKPAVAKKSATRAPLAKKPATKKPTAKKPTAKKPAAKAPAAKKLTAKKPATRKPTAKKPAAKAPAAKASAAKKPAAKKPAAKVARPAAAKKAAAKTPEQTLSPAVVKAVAPLYLLVPTAYSPDWTLCLGDNHSPVDIFEEEGHSGNGYAWDSVARVAMKPLAKALARAISFDSEAGTFVALCDRFEPLFELGKALAALLRDERALRRAIRAVPEDDWDD